MINVSLKDLLVGTELPAPRIAARPDTNSAFAALIEQADSRQDTTAREAPRERPVAPRERPQAARESLNDSAPRRDNGKPTTTLDAAPKANDIESVATDPTTRDTAETTSIANAGDKVDASAAPGQKPADEQNPSAQSSVVVAVAIEPQSIPAAVPQATIASSSVANHEIAPQAGASGRGTLPNSAATQDSGRGNATNASDAPPTGTGTVSPQTSAANADVAPQAGNRAASSSAADTLFNATLLNQSIAPESEIILPQAVAPASTDDASKLPQWANELIARDIARPQAQTQTAAAAVTPDALKEPVVATPANSRNSTAATPAAATQNKLDLLTRPLLENIAVTVKEAPAPLTPPPALANGMLAQLQALQSDNTRANAPTAPTPSPLINAADGGAIATQTAIAVPAAGLAQQANDQPSGRFGVAPENTPITGPSPASSHTAAGATTASAKAPVAKPLPFPAVADQVAVQIAKAAAEGSDKISIKLKPASLGQIEVQLDVAADGRVNAVIAADKAETLDMLQRDSRALERALGDAGLRTDSGSLSFNLRGQNQHGGQSSQFAGLSAPDRGPAAADLTLLADSARIGAYVNSRAAAGGVDIRV